MTRRRIHTFTVNAAALSPESDRTTGQKQLQRLAELVGDGSVAAQGTEPGDLFLSGVLRQRYAERLAEWLRELLTAPEYEALEVYDPDGRWPESGYYTADNVVVRRVESSTEDFYSYEATLVREGTRESRLRAVRSTPADLATPFGSDEEPYLGIPEAATLRQWFDPETQMVETPITQETVTGDQGDVDLVDPTSSSLADPVLTFKLPYENAGDVDAAVFDTFGSATETDADGVLAWAQAFRADHEFEGEAVLDNTLIRLFVDDDAETLRAEKWGVSSGSASGGLGTGVLGDGALGTSFSVSGGFAWNAVSLGTSDWVVTDFDLVSVAPASVHAQLTFRDTTDDSLYALDAGLHRGWKHVQFTVPPNEASTVPSGLQTLLSPIASPRSVAPGATETLIDRKEVRR
jgi:hypothetical protein